MFGTAESFRKDLNNRNLPSFEDFERRANGGMHESDRQRQGAFGALLFINDLEYLGSSNKCEL